MFHLIWTFSTLKLLRSVLVRIENVLRRDIPAVFYDIAETFIIRQRWEIAEHSQIADSRKNIYWEQESEEKSCSYFLLMFLRVSWDTEEEDERKGRGCMLQYQHSLIRVLTVFTANSPDSSSPSPAYFLSSDWQVDVTRLVRYFLRVGDTSVARLQAGTVLTGKAVGVTTVQVMVVMTQPPRSCQCYTLLIIH